MRFLRCFQMDLRRAILSFRFLSAVSGYGLLLCLNLPIDPWPEESTYLFMVSYKYGFYIFYFLCAAIPFATSFLSDVDQHFLLPVVRRIPLVTYSASKCLVTAISGALAVICASLLFLLFLLVKYPLYPDNTYSYSGWDLLIPEHGFLWYFIVKVTITAILGGSMAVVALVISAKIRNSFVTLAAPVLIYYVWKEIAIAFQLPIWMDIGTWTYFPMFSDNYVLSYLCVLVFGFTLSAISYLLFYTHMRRLQKNGYST